MVNTVDERLSIGGESGQHKPCRGSQIGRHDRRSGEPLDARADRRIALELNIGTHALQFEDVLEAVLENRLGDGADAGGDRIQRTELGLHVGGKCGIRGRPDVHRA